MTKDPCTAASTITDKHSQHSRADGSRDSVSTAGDYRWPFKLNQIVQLRIGLTAAYGRGVCDWNRSQRVWRERKSPPNEFLKINLSIDKLNLKILTVSDLRLDVEQVKGGTHSFTASHKHTQRDRDVWISIMGGGGGFLLTSIVFKLI